MSIASVTCLKRVGHMLITYHVSVVSHLFHCWSCPTVTCQVHVSYFYTLVTCYMSCVRHLTCHVCLTCRSHWSRVSHILIVNHVDCVHVTCSRVVSHVCYMSATSHMSRVCRHMCQSYHVSHVLCVGHVTRVYHVLVTCHVSDLSPCLLLVIFHAHVSYMFLSRQLCHSPSHFDVSVMCCLCVGNVSDMSLTCQLHVYVFHTCLPHHVVFVACVPCVAHFL